jgi:hypothetical protein
MEEIAVAGQEVGVVGAELQFDVLQHFARKGCATEMVQAGHHLVGGEGVDAVVLALVFAEELGIGAHGQAEGNQLWRFAQPFDHRTLLARDGMGERKQGRRPRRSVLRGLVQGCNGSEQGFGIHVGPLDARGRSKNR